MDDMFARFTGDLMARVSGPMTFRLVLQPAMAAFFAIQAGLADARAGRPPYFWGLVSGQSPREAMVESGWKSVGRVFILAVVLDVVYQLYVFRFVYPMEAFTVAVILAIVPYLVLRGLVTRLAGTTSRARLTRASVSERHRISSLFPPVVSQARMCHTERSPNQRQGDPQDVARDSIRTWCRRWRPFVSWWRSSIRHPPGNGRWSIVQEHEALLVVREWPDGSITAYAADIKPRLILEYTPLAPRPPVAHRIW